MSCAPAMLSQATFLEVVRNTPLVSMDLLLCDASGRLLTGHRTNPPAQGFWFAPGGRIRKNETLEAAFFRLTQTELGQSVPLALARLVGVYEHFYVEDFTGGNASTHYVVLAYTLTVDAASLKLPTAQHDDYRWVDLLLDAGDLSIHANTRAYFEALRSL